MALINPNLLRLFSNGESFLDNSGKPLVGEIEVFDKDQMGRPCQIYDVNGNYISNPQPTTDIGRPVQNIYLENKKSYIINFYKYIGESRFDREFQYSVELPKNIFVVDYGEDIDSQAVWYFDTMDKMTAEGQHYEVGRIYGLKGYYEAGDKDIVYYRCEDYVGGDDGGSNISVYDISDEVMKTMRLIPPSEKYFDVRHFGVFPYPNETVNLSQLQRCDTYCYENGYVMSFVPNDDNAIYFIENANTTLQSEIYGTSQTLLSFSNSTVNLTLDDCFVNISNNNSTINVYGYTLHQSNNANNNQNTKLNPSINYIVDKYTPNKIEAKNVNLIITTDSIENVYDIDNCKIYSENKINLGKANTIKNCYIKQSYFTNLSENNIKNQTLSGNTTNKSDWFLSYYWIAFLIVGKQQIIDLNGDVSLGGYTLDIDVDTVIRNGTLSNGNITYPQGQFTMENVTCNSNAIIRPYTELYNLNNGYNVYLNNCKFQSPCQFKCRTLIANNCVFGSGCYIDCMYVNVVNNTFKCDVSTASYVSNNNLIASLSNNIFEYSNLYIRPGTEASSGYISEDWNESKTMWNYGCTIINNTFKEGGNGQTGHIIIYPQVWYRTGRNYEDTIIADQTGYICKELNISNNNVVTNFTPSHWDLNKPFYFVQWPDRPTPGDPSTGKLYKYTGAYTYKNNTGDCFDNLKILNLLTRRSTDGNVNNPEIVVSKGTWGGSVAGTYCYYKVAKIPLEVFIFSFGEERSKREIKYKFNVDSKYLDYEIPSQLIESWYLSDTYVIENANNYKKQLMWYKKNLYEDVEGSAQYLKGIGSMTYTYIQGGQTKTETQNIESPKNIFISTNVPQYLGSDAYITDNTASSMIAYFPPICATYEVTDGYPATTGHDQDPYHWVIIRFEEL